MFRNLLPLIGLIFFAALLGSGCSIDNVGRKVEKGETKVNELERAPCHDPSTGEEFTCDPGEECFNGRCFNEDSCLNNDGVMNEEGETILGCEDDEFCNGDPDHPAGANACVPLECDPAQCEAAVDHRCVRLPEEQCCIDDTTCADNQACENNACVDLDCEDNNPLDCFDAVAQNNECELVRRDGCCIDNNDCNNDPRGAFCNMGGDNPNTCVECLIPTDCPDGQTCGEDNTCVVVECDPQPDECTSQEINPDTRECEATREDAPGCCLNDAECGDGFCPEAGGACVECEGNNDCEDVEFCNAEGVCEPVLCPPAGACRIPRIENNECFRDPVEGNCCDFDADCAEAGGVCVDNACVQCREDAQCGEGQRCNPDLNVCFNVDCEAELPAPICNVSVFNEDTRECELQVVPTCCTGPQDDASCRRGCNNDDDCLNGEVCGRIAEVGELVCVPANLPDQGYTVGCAVNAVDQEENSCTTCQTLNDGSCVRFDICNNGLDDNGDGRTDEGLPNAPEEMPNALTQCVECNLNSDCAGDLVCNPIGFFCEVEPECRFDVDCPVVGEECIEGVCAVPDPCEEVQCEAGEQCEAGQCVAIDPCEGIVCGDGQICEAGQCVAEADPCEGIVCGEGQVCEAGQCVAEADPCEGIVCGEGQVCEAGQCVAEADPCEGIVCGDGQVCEAGQCVAEVDPCEGVVCGDEQVCQAGQCVAALPSNDALCVRFEGDTYLQARLSFWGRPAESLCANVPARPGWNCTCENNEGQQVPITDVLSIVVNGPEGECFGDNPNNAANPDDIGPNGEIPTHPLVPGPGDGCQR